MAQEAADMKTLTEAGGIQRVGSRVHFYILRSNGAVDATLQIRRDSEAGPVVFKDICVGRDRAKMSGANRPIGVHGNIPLYAEVTGDGAECDIGFN